MNSKDIGKYYKQWSDARDIAVKLVLETRHICQPIHLVDNVINLINREKILKLELCLNDFSFVCVDIRKHPQSIMDGRCFMPFFCDKPFDLYKLGLKYNEISVKAYDDQKELIYTQILKKNEIDDTTEDFMLRRWDDTFIAFRVSGGAGGFPYG